MYIRLYQRLGTHLKILKDSIFFLGISWKFYQQCNGDWFQSAMCFFKHLYKIYYLFFRRDRISREYITAFYQIFLTSSISLSFMLLYVIIIIWYFILYQVARYLNMLDEYTYVRVWKNKLKMIPMISIVIIKKMKYYSRSMH